MSETPVPVAAEAEPAPKPAKVKRFRQIRKLNDAAGGLLEVFVEEQKDGTYRTSIKHTVRGEDGKVDREKSQGRGEVVTHATRDEADAKATADVQAAQAAKWTLKASGSGGAATKSSFTLANLPKPAKAAK